MKISEIINVTSHPINDEGFRARCRAQLDQQGALVLPDFINSRSIAEICQEGDASRHRAYFSEAHHNVYLTSSDPDYAADHPRNRQVITTKGGICDDEIADNSSLRTLYNDEEFQRFLCHVLGEQALFEYADSLSSINLHYAGEGQELGWHFDNSSFAITLMIQPPEKGGSFDYVSNVRNSDQGEMNFGAVEAVLDGKMKFETLSLGAGALALFRGRNSIHRVAPVQGSTTRILAVLAYNSKTGVALSESARMDFYGRLE